MVRGLEPVRGMVVPCGKFSQFGWVTGNMGGIGDTGGTVCGIDMGVGRFNLPAKVSGVGADSGIPGGYMGVSL